MRVFLSAEWRDLVMVNYAVDAKLLHDYVPPGTVLDSFDGRTYVSLVGFQFRRTKLFGALRVPFHRDFDEINLRFYVRHREGNEDRRGVVFIAEIVPRWAIAKVARMVYGENYIRLPMKHRIDTTGASIAAEYEWLRDGAWSKFTCTHQVLPRPPPTAASSNSLPSTIGVTRSSETAARSNIASRMCPGMCGTAPRPDLKATPPVSTAPNSAEFFNGVPILRSLPTVRRSRYCRGRKSSERLGRGSFSQN